jgi:DNA-binding response OmpR family regulator
MADLRAENEELRERVRQLEKLLRDPLPELWNFPLTAMKRRMLGLLYRTHGTVLRERLEYALHGADSDVGEKCMDVHLVVLRKKCRVHGITIETVWGTGYRLTAESRLVVRDLIDRQAQIAAAAFNSMNATKKGERHAVG